MRQRTINWNGHMRDMRRYRSPEQMLIREMLAALKAAQPVLAEEAELRESACIPEYLDQAQKALRAVDAAITKAERHTNG